jgi:hypothetical protein
MARYEAGETLSSIARTYDCSPPAISYIVSRSRAGQAKAVTPPPAPVGGIEPQLIKAAAANGSVNLPSVAGERHDEIRLRDAAGPEPTGLEATGLAGIQAGARPAGLPTPPRPPSPPPAATAGNGDARPRLHLSLGAPPAASSAASLVETPPVEPAHGANGQQARPPAAAERDLLPPNREAYDTKAPSEPDNHVGGPSGHYGPARPRNGDGAEHRSGAGSFIDRELRARVDGDITAFLAAFDAALGQDTQENRALLREATDRLLRAGARTRIELERLEARVPLAPRDAGRRTEPAWRDR